MSVKVENSVNIVDVDFQRVYGFYDIHDIHGFSC